MVDEDPTLRNVAIIPLRFWNDHIERDGELVEVDMVEWVKRGHQETTVKRVSRAQRDETIWPAIKKYYEHWKEGQAEPVNGTPLDAWPACTREMASKLRGLHLRSVEDVAEADESTLGRIGMGARDLKRKAEAFCANKEGNQNAAAIAKQQQQLEQVLARCAELEEQVKLMEASGIEAPAAPKRRGRPPKAA